MYKNLLIILSIALIATLTACGSSGSNPNPTPTASPTPTPTVIPTALPSPNPTTFPVPNGNNPNNDPPLTDQQITKMVLMLTSPVGDFGAQENYGLAYTATTGALNNKVLPLSYYNTADYWGSYVCNISGNNCHVTESYLPAANGPAPDQNTPGADLQYERVNVNSGTDIYDAATWQIALAVAKGYSIAGASYDTANNQNSSLTLGYDGNASAVSLNANRANTASFIFGYPVNGGVAGNDISADQAYMFRMITRNWSSYDPFYSTNFATQYITANDGLTPGVIAWSDWKPITGENAWAFLIGPLQALYLENNGAIPSSALSGEALQNAINVLYSISLMQSPIGAVYYAPKGSYGNTGSGLVNPYTVSIENNASTLAGLLMLDKILTNLESSNPTTIAPILTNLNSMIWGGDVSFNNESPRHTDGLLYFFKTYAFDKDQGIFVQEGHANDPSESAVWVAGVDGNGNLKTVDVNTWTVAVLGQGVIDSWFGEGTAYQIWQHVKQFGGFYGPDNKLWGVGYSDADGDGYTTTPSFNSNGILSTEWSAGAINMAKILAFQYESSSVANKAAYVAALNDDIASMSQGVLSLSTANYNGSGTTINSQQPFPDGPDNYSSLVPSDPSMLGFMYASKRYFIPFGWYANPLPSTCSTSWMIMINYNFNPFTLGGSYIPNLVY